MYRAWDQASCEAMSFGMQGQYMSREPCEVLFFIMFFAEFPGPEHVIRAKEGLVDKFVEAVESDQ